MSPSSSRLYAFPIVSQAEPSASATTMGHGDTPRSEERDVGTHAPPRRRTITSPR